MKLLIPYEKIQKRVKELAEQINQDFEGKQVLFVGVLNGAFMFFADLLKHIKLKAQVDFVQLQSYQNNVSTGKVIFIKDLTTTNLEGGHIIVVDDIIDTGLTLASLVQTLKQKNPATIKTAVLLDKPKARKVDFKADYVGFEIPPVYVRGYGLDKDGLWRNLPGIYTD